MDGVDYLEKQPYIDKDRMAAAGASFGGYMMNWFAGNTGEVQDAHHATAASTTSTACTRTTDELWFDEWEHGGPPWGKNRESLREVLAAPQAANLGKFKTPMLIIHNDLDFRVPVSQGQRAVHDAASGRASRRSSSTSPTRATGC